MRMNEQKRIEELEMQLERAKTIIVALLEMEKRRGVKKIELVPKR